MNETAAFDESELFEEERLPALVLRQEGIPFIRLTHPAAYSMELCRGVGSEYGACHCKNLFLANRSGTSFYLLLMDAEKPFRTSLVSRALGVSRLSFGTEEQLKRVLGLQAGSVSALGILNECAEEYRKAGALKIAVDSDLIARERICVHPNTNRATYVLETNDLVRLMTLRGFDLVSVNILEVGSEM